MIRTLLVLFIIFILLNSCGGNNVNNPQGNPGVPGTNGIAGSNGLPGPVGSPGPIGPAGSSCTATQIAAGDAVLTDGGAIINCGTTSAMISNGRDGLNGTDGTNGTTSAYAITSILDPCGDAPGISDEVFLKLADGTILWLQVDNASGLNARLSIAQPGNWVTTDGDNCQFTLNADGTISNESHKD